MDLDWQTLRRDYALFYALNGSVCAAFEKKLYLINDLSHRSLRPFPSTAKFYPRIVVLVGTFSKCLWLCTTRSTGNKLRKEATIFGNTVGSYWVPTLLSKPKYSSSNGDYWYFKKQCQVKWIIEHLFHFLFRWQQQSPTNSTKLLFEHMLNLTQVKQSVLSFFTKRFI